MSGAFHSVWERLLGRTESPIEAEFLVAFCETALDAGYLIRQTPKADDTIGVKPQKVVDHFRLDFAITFIFRFSTLQIAVETDGKAFHDRTPGQADRDRSRDRALQSLGYEVMRFSGREINENAVRCAMEVVGRIQDFQTLQITGAFDRAEAAE